MNQESIETMVGASFLPLEDKTFSVTDRIEAVKISIDVLLSLLPKIESVKHIRPMFFLESIKHGFPIYLGILRTFEKDHVLSIPAIAQASYAVNRKGHLSLWGSPQPYILGRTKVAVNREV